MVPMLSRSRFLKYLTLLLTLVQNEIANQRGFINVDIDETWLNGNTVVAAQLLIAADATTATNGGAHWGPIITLQGTFRLKFNYS